VSKKISNTDRIVSSRTDFRRPKSVYYIRLSQCNFSNEDRTASSIGITVRPKIRQSEQLHELQEEKAHLLAADDVYTPAPNLRDSSIHAHVSRIALTLHQDQQVLSRKKTPELNRERIRYYYRALRCPSNQRCICAKFHGIGILHCRLFSCK